MKDELIKLYNTLCCIETKGENTKLMSNCLQYLEGLIAREQLGEHEPAQAEECSEE